jgi:hypothetical protein
MEFYMSTMTSLTIADGQSTPQNHTFDVQNAQVGDKPAVWMDKISGTYQGFSILTSILRRSEAGRAYRVKLTLAVPTLAVTAPASGTGIQPLPTQAYVTRATIEFILPDGCTLQDRKDILAYVQGALSKTVISDQVVNLSSIY